MKQALQLYLLPADAAPAILQFTSAACAAVGVQLVSPTSNCSNMTSLVTSSKPSEYKLPHRAVSAHCLLRERPL